MRTFPTSYFLQQKTSVNSQHENATSKGDFVLKNLIKDFGYTK